MAKLVFLYLIVVLHTACSAHSTQSDTDAKEPTRLAIRFHNVQTEPPEEIPIETHDGIIITVALEHPLSGGFFRYSVPAVSRQQLQYIVDALSLRPDIETIERDQRRRID